MSIFKKLKAKHWGNKAIIAIILGTIAAICLTLVIGAYSRIHELENTATAEYRCDEVVFGFNDDETTAKPLGYYVEARYYAENGEMSKEYHYISDAKQSYEAYKTIINIEQFFGVISEYLTPAEQSAGFFIFTNIFFTAEQGEEQNLSRPAFFTPILPLLFYCRISAPYPCYFEFRPLLYIL